MSTNEDDGLALIYEAKAKVEAKALKLLDAKEAAKAAKEAHDTAVEELMETIRDVQRGGPALPLFDKPRAEAGAEDTSWREAPLSDLGLSPGILKALAECEGHPITTVGQLADWTAAEHRLTDIKGIGEGKAEEIDKALELFWAARKAAGPAKGEASPEVVEEAFAALLSVGHTDEQARKAIDGALATGAKFKGVPDLLDAIYEQRREAEGVLPEGVSLSINRATPLPPPGA
jgi:hypothetical protein